MQIEKNISLKSHNTFGIDVVAKRFMRVEDIPSLQTLLETENEAIFILGGGSNILLSGTLEQLVLQNAIKGIAIVSETENNVTIAVGGGENWHQLVRWAVKNDLGGIENLSLIPGTVGAAPIQNIGAYGVELKDVFVKLEAVHLQSGTIHSFDLKACQFGYRTSVFKQKCKGLFFITKVFLQLTKKGSHRINSSYGAIRSTLEKKGIKTPTIRQVSDAVIDIRSSKLPDPKLLGNSGSFFKNPVIPKSQFLTLQKAFPDIVFYELENEEVKIPAGWLIEQCGWKGKKVGNVACYEKQALVIVNLGNADGKEIIAHAERVIASVKEKFGIQLYPEVTIIRN